MNLQELRIKAQLTQEELAKKTKIPKGTLRDWEQNGFPRQIVYLVALKEKLNCSYEELLKDLSKEET